MIAPFMEYMCSYQWLTMVLDGCQWLLLAFEPVVTGLFLDNQLFTGVTIPSISAQGHENLDADGDKDIKLSNPRFVIRLHHNI